MTCRDAVMKTVDKRLRISDPRVADMLVSYVDSYMAELGPYISSVFFILLLNCAPETKRKKGFVRSVELSVGQIAVAAGISKRKTIDALRELKRYWITVQRTGKGRGNKNQYYFLPVERWSPPGTEAYPGAPVSTAEGDDRNVDSGRRSA
ncbi:MAG TPA: hypothetical protein DDZ40_02590 [Deltaproteobacteria bacterium]|nr:hypothetical protein [Deltaproteobacteria bacterium]